MPRVAFALAEQGDLPCFFGFVHSRFRTPYVALFAWTLCLWAFAVIGRFEWNLTLSAVARLLDDGAVCAALPVLRRKQPGQARLRLPAGPVFAISGVIICVALITQVDFSQAMILAVTFALASAQLALGAENGVEAVRTRDENRPPPDRFVLQANVPSHARLVTGHTVHRWTSSQELVAHRRMVRQDSNQCRIQKKTRPRLPMVSCPLERKGRGWGRWLLTCTRVILFSNGDERNGFAECSWSAMRAGDRGDLQFAFRTLRKTPLFTLAIVAALAFCIGLNAAIFSVVDTVLFRPLPFPHQDRLVSVTEGVPALGFLPCPFPALITCSFRQTADPLRPRESTGPGV